MPKSNMDGFIVKKALKPQNKLDNHPQSQASKSADLSQSGPDGFSGRSGSGESTHAQVDQLPQPVVGEDVSYLDSSELSSSDLSYKHDQPKTKRRFNLKKILKTKKFWAAIFLLILIPVIYFGYKYMSAVSKISGGGIPNPFSTTKLKGEDEGRVNILVSGTSEDDPGHEGAELTDSIMVVSINTVDNSALMLSIPRDLWINYQDDSSLGSQGKINEAYFRGMETSASVDQKERTKAGMENLQQVVTTVTGLPIHYYVKIDYQAFKQAVDAVGGVDINIDSGDPYCVGGGGIYDPYTNLKLSKGMQHLDGQAALNLSRARNAARGSCGMQDSDFSRTEYQRKIMIELRKKALSLGTLSNPAKVSNLLDSVGDNVYHSFNANEVLRLYELGKNINESSIVSEGLSTGNVLTDYQASNGASALAPIEGVSDYSGVKQFVRKLTSNDPVVKEEPSVVVLNGTHVSGLASTKSSSLESVGFKVLSFDNADNREYTNNQIIALNDQKVASLNLLKQQLAPVDQNSDQAIIANYKAAYPQADFVIIVGSNDKEAQQNQ